MEKNKKKSECKATCRMRIRNLQVCRKWRKEEFPMNCSSLITDYHKRKKHEREEGKLFLEMKAKKKMKQTVGHSKSYSRAANMNAKSSHVFANKFKDQAVVHQKSQTQTVEPSSSSTDFNVVVVGKSDWVTKDSSSLDIPCQANKPSLQRGQNYNRVTANSNNLCERGECGDNPRQNDCYKASQDNETSYCKHSQKQTPCQGDGIRHQEKRCSANKSSWINEMDDQESAQNSAVAMSENAYQTTNNKFRSLRFQQETIQLGSRQSGESKVVTPYSQNLSQEYMPDQDSGQSEVCIDIEPELTYILLPNDATNQQFQTEQHLQTLSEYEQQPSDMLREHKNQSRHQQHQRLNEESISPQSFKATGGWRPRSARCHTEQNVSEVQHEQATSDVYAVNENQDISQSQSQATCQAPQRGILKNSHASAKANVNQQRKHIYTDEYMTYGDHQPQQVYHQQQFLSSEPSVVHRSLSNMDVELHELKHHLNFGKESGNQEQAQKSPRRGSLYTPVKRRQPQTERTREKSPQDVRLKTPNVNGQEHAVNEIHIQDYGHQRSSAEYSYKNVTCPIPNRTKTPPFSKGQGQAWNQLGLHTNDFYHIQGGPQSQNQCNNLGARNIPYMQLQQEMTESFQNVNLNRTFHGVRNTYSTMEPVHRLPNHEFKRNTTPIGNQRSCPSAQARINYTPPQYEPTVHGAQYLAPPEYVSSPFAPPGHTLPIVSPLKHAPPYFPPQEHVFSRPAPSWRAPTQCAPNEHVLSQFGSPGYIPPPFPPSGYLRSQFPPPVFTSPQFTLPGHVSRHNAPPQNGYQ